MKFTVIHENETSGVECDFCGREYTTITCVDENTYICKKCACEINKHALKNHKYYNVKSIKTESK